MECCSPSDYVCQEKYDLNCDWQGRHYESDLELYGMCMTGVSDPVDMN